MGGYGITGYGEDPRPGPGDMAFPPGHREQPPKPKPPISTGDDSGTFQWKFESPRRAREPRSDDPRPDDRPPEGSVELRGSLDARVLGRMALWLMAFGDKHVKLEHRTPGGTWTPVAIPGRKDPR